jgi:hypothetical protein
MKTIKKNSFYTGSTWVLAHLTPEEFNNEYYDGSIINITLSSSKFSKIPGSVYTLYDVFEGDIKTGNKFNLSSRSNVRITIPIV